MADTFPRTAVAGVSLPRMLIGTNWFSGHSHTTAAKSRFIGDFQTVANITDILCVFMEAGVDAIMSPALTRR